MNKFMLMLGAAAFGCLTLSAQHKEVKISLIETTDIHGNYFPYDFKNAQPGEGSMARISSYVNRQRQERGKDAVVLLDNGDILQGQPSAYYYNYMDTQSTHLCAAVLNYMGYDLGTVGNHDVETGHAVYDRWVRQCQFPMLGANVIVTATGKPYWKPYRIIERKGVKIAVLGMITPGIPMWLPENLWKGLRFDDMAEVARRYMPEMRKQADVVVGLFHSGVGKADAASGAENASVYVAKTVPGFDIVFCGHDHREANRKVVNTAGDTVLVLNPAANAHAVAQADLTFTLGKKGKTMSKKVEHATIVNIDGETPDPAFMAHFKPQYDAVKQFTSEQIGINQSDMITEPAFFGSSAFIDFIHQMQLRISGADISFAAPLAFDARIPAGPIHVSDMFKLYAYENLLYVMNLTGQEIQDFLEFSYGKWVSQMHSPADHLLLFRENAASLPDPWQRLQNPSYNFDSAAGIRYTVDVTKPIGQRVSIESMADGQPFDLKHTYRVALNSYRGNGGGGLLTQGAGIPEKELPQRIVWSTEKDLRYYLMTSIREMGTINPQPLNQWRFVPEEWVKQAAERDAVLLRP